MTAKLEILFVLFLLPLPACRCAFANRTSLYYYDSFVLLKNRLISSESSSAHRIRRSTNPSPAPSVKLDDLTLVFFSRCFFSYITGAFLMHFFE